jgi:hypothetical protein
MNYSLHPEAEADLRDASEFYRERADKTLAQSFLAEFEQSLTNSSGILDWVHRGRDMAAGATS